MVDETMTGERMFAKLCTGFASLAPAIACVGLYGSIAYTVARRTGEIGIRIAVGAARTQVLWLVIRQMADKKLWDEIIPLFTQDARVEIGGRGVYVGRTSVGHLFKDVMGGGKEGLEYGPLHNHMQLQGVVDVDPGGKDRHGPLACVHAGGCHQAERVMGRRTL